MSQVDENELMEALERGKNKFLNEKVKNTFKNWNKTISYKFTDIDKEFYFTLNNGVPGPITEGTPEKADIRYEMDTETFMAIDRKEISGMEAYKKKKVKVKGKMPDLMKLQKLDKV